MDFIVSRRCNKTRARERVVFNKQIFYMIELGNKTVGKYMKTLEFVAFVL